MTAQLDKQLISEGLPSQAGAAMGMTGQAIPATETGTPGDVPSLATQQSTLQNYGK